MKLEDLGKAVDGLKSSDFKAVEVQLTEIDKHLTLRTYVHGYTLSELDSSIWLAIRTNRVAYSFLKRAPQINLVRWFNFVEQNHPEIHAEIKAQDEAERAKKTVASKAGGNYNMVLPDADKAVVTRFPPEPS